jgi:Ca2+/Na+ antiporter
LKFQLAAAALAAAFIGLAAASGEHRFGALVGSAIAGLTGLASILALRFTARAARPTHGALAVVVVGFLVRLVLLALGTVAVVRGGGNIIAFVIAFFVPFFAFVALEATYVHTLRPQPGETTA